MRDGINRLRHAKKYSGEHAAICVTSAVNGYTAGTGKLAGVDPREMAAADVVVIWGTNAASTQVNVMVHALRARRERGAKLLSSILIEMRRQNKPTAFSACALGPTALWLVQLCTCCSVDGHADRAYLERYTDCPAELESHLETRTPAWAETICGVPAAEIEAFAQLIGTTPRSFSVWATDSHVNATVCRICMRRCAFRQ